MQMFKVRMSLTSKVRNSIISLLVQLLFSNYSNTFKNYVITR